MKKILKTLGFRKWMVKNYSLVEGLAEAVDFIEKHKQSKQPIIIGVAGGSASGKTHQVAQKIVEHFGDKALMLSMDNYYRGKKFIQEEAANGKHVNFDMPNYVDTDKLTEDVNKLRNNETITQPVYDFKSNSSVGEKLVEPKKIVIVEGIHALNKKIAGLYDLKIFVQASLHGRLLRRLSRDISRSARLPENTIKTFLTVVEPMHALHVEPTKKQADFIIENEYLPEKEAGLFKIS